MPRFIDPLDRLGSRLLEVEKPARYTGGEYGTLARRGPGIFLYTAVVFPDLYELGMCNQAFRILYNGLNRLEGISCDRAFAPAPDFEGLLKEEGLCLYGLDTGIPLAGTDLLLFTLGYELGITGILSVLDSARIPLRVSDRGGEDPIVMAGGPCVSNPLPFSPFVDLFWIGEAEAGFFELAGELAEIKKRGGARGDLLDRAAAHPHVWRRGKSGVRRGLEKNFGRGGGAETAAVFPVSSIKTVQHHGAVEIMRGCPNGCRFCHAGIWYRPMRQKRADLVMAEAEAFIRRGGYREISLSSLSSGDYDRVLELTAALNERWKSRGISFQLPSLRVSGFSLSLLETLSELRRSGLTFAVETPAAGDQKSINKVVALDEVISISRAAKQRGWRGVKCYFMLGLPLDNPRLPLGNPRLPLGTPDTPGAAEEEGIIDFILEAGRAASVHFHVNAGTFVPKPHTPYERAPQLDVEEAWKKLHRIRDALKRRGHKVSVHNPFTSLLEGIIARGDEGAGIMAEEAYRRGCRLDAWSEHINTGVWKTLLAENPERVRPVLEGFGGPLPWSVVQSGAGEDWLDREAAASREQRLTPPCTPNCDHRCGICGTGAEVAYNTVRPETGAAEAPPPSARAAVSAPAPAAGAASGGTWRMIFIFSKTGPAVFVPHLGLIEVFSAAIIRSGLPVSFTRGFNPLPGIDFASPAPLGLSCRAEAASMDLDAPLEAADFLRSLREALPEGFTPEAAECFFIPPGIKKHSVAAVLWGFRYGETLVPAAEEKAYRRRLPPPEPAGSLPSASDTDGEESGRQNIYGLVRDAVLAKNVKDGGPAPYIDLYRDLYPHTPP
ncbi:MAG: TIGR03936 family radical SAM-associated protein [Treponema sp.]|jgi:radical SAM superfamily enzyme YgiQ (UPF0313 family)|nr:TIGR03936 family radical SAM-associated protein [Treponema sp.]